MTYLENKNAVRNKAEDAGENSTLRMPQSKVQFKNDELPKEQSKIKFVPADEPKPANQESAGSVKAAKPLRFAIPRREGEVYCVPDMPLGPQAERLPANQQLMLSRLVAGNRLTLILCFEADKLLSPETAQAVKSAHETYKSTKFEFKGKVYTGLDVLGLQIVEAGQKPSAKKDPWPAPFLSKEIAGNSFIAVNNHPDPKLQGIDGPSLFIVAGKSLEIVAGSWQSKNEQHCYHEPVLPDPGKVLQSLVKEGEIPGLRLLPKN